MAVGIQIDDLPPLTLPVVAGDKVLVGRSGQLLRNDDRFIGSPAPRLAVAIPSSADFSTWVNQNGSVVTDEDASMAISHDDTVTGGDQLSCRVRSLPGGSWDVRLGIICQWKHQNFVSGGIVLRESGTGKLLTSQFGHIANSTALVKWNSPTSFNSIVKEINGRPQKGFVRLLKNGSNIEFYMSTDGVYWGFVVSTSITGAFTTAPDQWGVYLSPYNQSGDPITPRIDAFHWSE